MTSVPVDAAAVARAAKAKRRRLFWMQQARLWHWVSSALCMVCLVCFAITGFTLNHATQIEAKARVTTRTAQLPAPLVAGLAGSPTEGKGAAPPALRDWAKKTLNVQLGDHLVEWSPEEAYVGLPRPGGDAWLTVDRQTGAVEYEKTTRGAVALLNDLHKGRSAGFAWSLFIDIFAGACLVFALSGLILLQLHAQGRPMIWPLVGAGLAIPVVLILITLHL